MYVQREESVHICFVQDKEADGKRHINGRPAQGEKLLGDPAAVQSPTVMVQATGVKPALNWANVCSPNILRTLRRTMIRFLIERLVRRIWFGQSKLYFILNWLVMRCKLRPKTCDRRAADSMIENVG